MSPHPAEPYEEETRRDAPGSVAPGSPWVWLLPIVAIAALLLGYGSCRLEPRLSVSAPATATAGPVAGSPLVDFDTWFSFDRLEFETGSATLRESSQEQLQNIAAILKAYPAVDLKIGGYTDDVGEDASNLELSQSRATHTMNALVELGVASSRLAAEGYGERYPVAGHDTADGRQRNRRIDIRVTKK